MSALQRVQGAAAALNATVHTPRLGTDSGVDWYGAERMLKKYLMSKGVPVTVYFYSRRPAARLMQSPTKATATGPPPPSPPSVISVDDDDDDDDDDAVVVVQDAPTKTVAKDQLEYWMQRGRAIGASAVFSDWEDNVKFLWAQVQQGLWMVHDLPR